MESLIQHFLNELYLSENKKKINILFIGKTGAGKTTLINTFANYFYNIRYQDERKILVSQIMPLNIEGNTKLITLKKNIGSFNEDSAENILDQSHSQTMKSYIHTLMNDFYEIKMIDTPGLLDTRGINEDIKNIENILTTIINLQVIHAICFVHKSTDSRIDASFKYYAEEFKSILPEKALKNMFVCFTNVINPNKIDGLNSLKEINFPARLDNVLFFENDCLLPYSAVEDEDYHMISKKFWQKNEKNYNQLLIKCESIDPILTNIFYPIVVYKTIFFKLDFIELLNNFHESISQLQRAIIEIKDCFKNNEIEKAFKGFWEFFKEFQRFKPIMANLRTMKVAYQDALSQILQNYPIPKNKYLKEYITFLKENKKIDENLFKEICQRFEFEEIQISENLEQEKLRDVFGSVLNCPNDSKIMLEFDQDKGFDITVSGNPISLFVNIKYVEFIVYSQKDYGTIYRPNLKWVGRIINRIPTNGNLYFTNGSRFEGQFNGHGTMFKNDGIRIVSTFNEGGLQGNGTIYFPLGDVLECNYQNNSIIGTGTWRWANGNKWIGALSKEGRPDGYGTFYCSNGDYVVGQMSGGFLNGNATLYTKGKTIYGNFLNGTFTQN